VLWIAANSIHRARLPSRCTGSFLKEICLTTGRWLDASQAELQNMQSCFSPKRWYAPPWEYFTRVLERAWQGEPAAIAAGISSRKACKGVIQMILRSVTPSLCLRYRPSLSPCTATFLPLICAQVVVSAKPNHLIPSFNVDQTHLVKLVALLYTPVADPLKDKESRTMAWIQSQGLAGQGSGRSCRESLM
jgi:hypothetical protein